MDKQTLIGDKLPNTFYELRENQENKFTIQITEEDTVHFSIDNWYDFATMEISKEEAVILAEQIIKHCS